MPAVILTLLLVAQAASPPGEIGERLAKPPTFAFESPKAPETLELCVADAISKNLTAAAFSNGPGRHVIVGSLNFQFHNGVPVVVELVRAGPVTRVIGHSTKGDSWLQDRIRSCL